MLGFLKALFWPLWFNKSRKFIKIPSGCIAFTSPYLDIHGDYLQLYFTKKNGRYFLTDDGATIRGLEDSGLLNDRKGKELLGSLLIDNLLGRSGNQLWRAVNPDNADEIYQAFIDKLREITLAFENYGNERK